MTIRAQRLAVLGSTGSIGESTLGVIRNHPQRYVVHALAANRDADTMLKQCLEFRPSYAALVDEHAATRLRQSLQEAGSRCEVLAGNEALDWIAGDADVDIVMAAIVGAAGLSSTLRAASTGKRILLANKESMVMAGALLGEAVRKSSAQLLPVDSEHNAIFQSLPAGYQRGLEVVGVRRVILTASGGPFLRTPESELSSVTPEQACAHPKWSMGRKISVDSATLMNKGLEVIEAHFLFGAKPEQISVVIHPQSIVHSMVEYIDGSVIAQLGNPDMRTPIAHALAYPERVHAGVKPLNLVETGRLDFEEPDVKRFPCLALAFDALAAGGSAPIYVNAANEVAVSRFLDREIGFNAIAEVVAAVLEDLPSVEVASLEQVLAADRAARVAATRLGRRRISPPRVASGLGQ